MRMKKETPVTAYVIKIPYKSDISRIYKHFQERTSYWGEGYIPNVYSTKKSTYSHNNLA